MNLPLGLDAKSVVIGVIVGAVVLPMVQQKLASRKG